MEPGWNSGGTPGEDSVKSSRAEQIIELSVFLFLIVPSMVVSSFVVKQGTLNFVVVAIATILRDISLVSLIFFFIWRNGEAVSRIGWTFKKPLREAGIGIALFIPFFSGTVFLENALRLAGFSAPSRRLPSFLAVKGVAEIVLVVVLVVVVALAEEIIFRGYLILRLKTVTSSPAAAVLLSAAIFSLGHGYEGSSGVVTVGVMGLVFALIYLWRESLVAPIVIHFLQDFMGIIVFPFLGKG